MIGWIACTAAGVESPAGPDSGPEGSGETASCTTSTWYEDADGDGFGGQALSACEAPAGWIAAGGDCDDADPSVFPGAAESCDGADDDCDGEIDEEPADAGSWPADLDGDGWTGDSTIVACADPGGEPGDCDDADPAVHPGGVETWDGVDEDCDGATDDLLLEEAGAPFLTGRDDDAELGAIWLGFGDLDGDGQIDLAAGCPSGVVGGTPYGYGDVLSTADLALWAGPVHLYAAWNWAAAAGWGAFGVIGPDLADVSGDGQADLVIGGSDYYDGFGNLSLAVFAGPLGSSSPLLPEQASLRFTGHASYVGDPQGSVDQALDFDGDGVADLLYGAAQAQTDAYGRLSLFAPSALAPGDYGAEEADSDLSGVAMHDELGAGTSHADLDLDGYDDAMASAPGYGEDGLGAIYLFYGGPTWPASGAAESAADAVFLGEVDDNLGHVQAPRVGDFDRDGRPDLVLSGDHDLRVWPGSLGAPRGSLAFADAPTVVGGEVERCAAVADLDDDGVDDLAVGSDLGGVLVFSGTRLAAGGSFTEADASLSLGSARSRAGESLQARDLDGDGRADLVVADPSDAGTLWFLLRR